MNKDKFLSFEDAKDFVRGLKLKNLKDWQNYKKPVFIPSNPNRTYSDNWISWSDWLGTNNISQRDRKFLSFKEAKEFIQPLKFPSSKEYKKYHKINGIKNIPVNPDTNVEYINSGWISWNDFLGNDFTATNKREYLSYNEAEEFVHKLSLKNQKEWGKYCKSGKLPIDIPKAPSRHYENNGWISWGDWFGTGYIANSNRKYRNFKQARKFVRSLNLKTQNEWVEYCKLNKKPIDIPATPGFIYKDDGWISMSDWLGSGIIAPKIKSDSFLSYDEAKLFVHGLGLKTSTKWRNYVKSGKKPNNIPSNPADSYKNKGWVSWGDFLRGELDVEFLSFEECRDFVHKLGLKSWEEWIEYVKSGKKPKNIPSNPADYYKNKNKL